MSTFIVETPEAVWRAHGLDTMEQADAIAFCEALFAKQLSDERGVNPLISNATHLRGSAIWIRFPRVICNKWVHTVPIEGRNVPVVLMGDAAHTAHFSIGSGTKLAMEDAIALKQSFDETSDVAEALQRFEEVRKPIIEDYQAAAYDSMIWFENAREYMHQAPIELAYVLMTRSGKVDREGLRRRDPEFVANYEAKARSTDYTDFTDKTE